MGGLCFFAGLPDSLPPTVSLAPHGLSLNGLCLSVYLRNLLCMFSFHFFLILIKYLSRCVLHIPVFSYVESYRGTGLPRKGLQNHTVLTKPSQYKSLPDSDGHTWNHTSVSYFYK